MPAVGVGGGERRAGQGGPLWSLAEIDMCVEEGGILYARVQQLPPPHALKTISVKCNITQIG